MIHYTGIAADCGDQPPTAELRELFEANAPNLVACEWSGLPIPTGEHRLNFNCIAWSVGRPEVWVDPIGPVYLEPIETDGNPLTIEYRLVVSIDMVWGNQNGALSEDDINRFYANDPVFYKGDENPGIDPPWERNPWETFAGVTDPHTFTRLVGEDATPADADVMYYSGYHGAESWERACACGAGQWLMFRSKVGDGSLIEHVHDGVNGMQPPGTGEDYGTPCYYYEEAE